MGNQPSEPDRSSAATPAELASDEQNSSPDAAPRRVESVQSLLATAVTDGLGPHNGATPSAPPEQKPPSLLGDFRLVTKVGEGAMGTVYKGYQVSAQREVAVKVLFPHMARNQKLLERFYREARTMGHLSHPNIVQGYAVGEEQGWHYLAMEFVDGRSLQKWLGLLGRVSVGDSLHIVLACADALRYAHEHDLVHRDVKPDNILITRQGAVKLTDLGAVKWLEEDLSLTQTGHGIGTPCYMPLEQARNAKDADGRSDIYALGCVLYCLLTGKPPFNGATIVELIQAKDAARFTPARRFNPAVPERLDLIIDKMVAKQVKFRYQTCAEVIRDLKSLHLEYPALTFIPVGPDENATPLPETISAAAPTPSRESDTPLPGYKPIEVPVEEKPEASIVDLWHVKYHTSQGMVTKRLSTAQVRSLITDKSFDPTAVACRVGQGTFRFLSTYREFEPFLAARTARTSMDMQTSNFRKLYKKIDQEDRDRQDKEEEIESMSDWPVLIYRLAVLALIGGFGFVLIRLLFHWLSGMSVDV
jgi:serine/threonine-protein kinase